MANSVTLNEVLRLAKQLPLVEKVRVIKQIAPQIERELQSAQTKPCKSLPGLWRGHDISKEDIAEARREM